MMRTKSEQLLARSRAAVRALLGVGVVLGAGAGVVGCCEDDAPVLPVAPVERLTQDTGVDWALLIEPDRTVFLAPVAEEPPRLEGDAAPEDVAAEFLRRYGDVLGVEDADAELVAIGVDRDPDGPRVVFGQISGELAVEGAMLLVHFDARGGIQSVNGRYVPGLAALDRARPLSAEAAVDAAKAALPELVPDLADDLDPDTLDAEVGPMIAADAHEPPAMAYVVDITLGEARAWSLVVNAKHGGVYLVRDSDAHATVPGSGHGVWGEDDVKTFPVTPMGAGFELRAPATMAVASGCPRPIGEPEISVRRGAGDTDFTGVAVWSDDAHRWEQGVPDGEQGMAVDAFAHLRLAESYFRERHCRWSHDGVGGPVIAIIGVPKWAAWVGAEQRFGFAHGRSNWEYGAVKAGSGAVDVVAHEYTHAVLSGVRQCDTIPSLPNVYGLVRHGRRCRSGPGSHDQPGALGEGLADVFGNLAERYHAVDGADPLRFGEGVYCRDNPLASGQPCTETRDALRDLVDPSRFGGVEHMHGWLPGEETLHLNGGIIGKAFTMMTVGGTNEVSGITIPPGDAIGWEKAEWLWYKAIPALYESATFSAFANQTIQLAPLNGVSRTPVACAWVAVGVLYGDDVTRMWNVKCPESTAHGNILGHWDWTSGDWGTMSFVRGDTLLKEDGTSETLVRGVYSYRGGSVLLSCDPSLRKCAGKWFEGVRGCSYPNYGSAEFQLLANGTIDGRWNHVGETHWAENWDLARSLRGEIPPEDLTRLANDTLFQCR